MRLLVSDKNILLDWEAAGRLPTLFGWGATLVVPDVLFAQELTSRAERLTELGLQVLELDERGVQKDLPTSRRILEINPDHPMVKALGRLQEEGRAEEAAPLAHLLLDQARLVEGDVSDPAGLVQRLRALSELAAKGLGV